MGQASALASIGGFRILRELGRGGMGVVYLAESEESGERAALKTVLGLAPGQLDGLRREVAALARIRHPGIVRVLAYGEEERRPWYAMELCEGRTLRAMIEAPRTDPGSREATASPSRPRRAGGEPRHWTEPAVEALVSTVDTSATRSSRAGGPPGTASMAPEVVELGLLVVRRLCRSLSYLHGEGIIHRDLKPDNVMVTADRHPVIVDFGLATPLASREQIAAAGATAGTVHYMSPEQARGDLVDPRADLYALGCILYEILTGRVPFHGRTAAEVLFQHLNATALPPSAIGENVPPLLDRLVLDLLEKDPRHRPGHASVVSRVLGEIGVPDAEQRGPAPRDYLYRPALSGRDDVIDTLRNSLFRDPEGSFTAIGGESGIGKTRVALHLVWEARMKALPVMACACQPGAEGGPLHAFRPFLEKIAERCTERGPEETLRLLGSFGRALVPFFARPSEIPGLASLPEIDDLPPDAARDRLYSVLADALRSISSTRWLLIVDDLQWADDLTLGFLGHLLSSGKLAPQPVAIVATYRSDEIRPELAALLASQGTRRLPLRLLGGDAVAAVAADMLAVPEIPEPFLRQLVARTEGNPFFVSELLRSAMSDGLIARDRLGGWQLPERIARDFGDLPLPASLARIIESRLSGLTPGARALLDVAAIIGRELDAATLCRASGRAEDDAGAIGGIHELVTRQVLDDDAAGGLRFLHDKIREAVLATLDAGAAARTHRDVVTALEGSGQVHNPDVLAYHWDPAGDPARARPHHLLAARASEQRYALDEAERHYLAYLASGADATAEEVRARQSLGSLYLNSGRTQAAVTEHKIALEAARALGDRRIVAECTGWLGFDATLEGRLEDARGLLVDALETFRSLRDPLGEPSTRALLSQVLRDLGRLDEAIEQLSAALRFLRSRGEHRGAGLVLGHLATVKIHLGLWIQALAEADESVALLREHGNKTDLTFALGIRSDLLAAHGRRLDARVDVEEALGLARKTSDRLIEASFLIGLGSITRKEDPARAHDCFAQASALLEGTGKRGEWSVALANLAESTAEKGDLRGAAQLFERSLHALDGNGSAGASLRDKLLELPLLMGIAVVLRRSGGSIDGARRVLERSERIAAGAKAIPDLVRIACERGHAAATLGEPGHPHLDRARALLARTEHVSGSVLADALRRLSIVVETQESGTGVPRGELDSDLPDAFRSTAPSHWTPGARDAFAALLGRVLAAG
ncbi:MAG: protein kinase [Acidobacteriota bacterium]